MFKFFCLLFFPLLAFTQEVHKSPQEIQSELDTAENQFNRALKMLSPWYTGPLITPSATMMPPGNGNTQPYLFLIDNYAAYNEDRKSIKLKSHLVQLQVAANLLTGVTDNFDINVTAQGFGNWQFDHSGGGYGDMGITGGFLIYKQTRYFPAAKLTIGETFPTGQYKRLDRFGLNSTGGGAFATQFGLAFSKVILYTTKHPMNLRFFMGYKLSTTVDVRGFNSYGGGYECKGRVRPGNSFSVDFGYEVSFTQKWVGALDIAYSCTNKTKFHGNPGKLADGTPSSVGKGYSDNLSLAPAIEYNFNQNLGLIGGAWFSVYGRNSVNFAAGVISISYSFP